MKRRGPIAIIVLTFITLGIYGIVWFVKTKEEMNARGAKIPSALMLIVPLLNVYWLWLYSEGVGMMTKDKLSQVISFILVFLAGPIGMAIIQDSFNKIIDEEHKASTTVKS